MQHSRCFRPLRALPLLLLLPALTACSPPAVETPAPSAAASAPRVEPQFSLPSDHTHNRFSSTIPPVLTVAAGAIVEIRTKEATDGQLTPDSTAEELANLDFDPIHPLTGPIFVETAEPGDVLAVTLHEIEVDAWGWTAVVPGFGWLADEFPEAYLKTFRFEPGAQSARFSDRITIPLRPFPGVMGVAPAGEELLSTIPPRANGGNLDNKYLTAGTTVYFPVFVPGALFSIGDGHAAQGDGEVCGTAIEAPMRIVVELEVIKGARPLPEPQYETADFYGVTAFAETLDEAAKKATRYMIDYLVAEHGLERTEAYVLCSLAGDLKISEVVDLPHVLVSMHIPKELLSDG